MLAEGKSGAHHQSCGSKQPAGQIVMPNPEFEDIARQIKKALMEPTGQQWCCSAAERLARDVGAKLV
jgi:hypothetical protein